MTTTNEVRYPNVTVQLTGNDGNAYAIIGAVIRGLKEADVSVEERDAFREEATSGDYDHLLQTAMKWVAVQ